MIPVEGGIIKAIGFNQKTGQMHIQFVKGMFVFDEVPAPLHESFMRADDKMAFFRFNVKGIYPHRKVKPEHKTKQ